MMLLPNLPPAVEGIRHRQENTKAFMNQRPLGEGTLIIAESRVTWVKDGDDRGLSLEYPHIAIIAISRDTASFSFPCIYLMIDVEMEPQQENEGTESDNEDEEGMTEIRFVPADHMALEPMYKSLNDCQVLHPNPEDVESEDEIGEEENEDEGEYIVSDPGQNGFHAPGTYEDNMEGNLENNDDESMETGQFDDAEDM